MICVLLVARLAGYTLAVLCQLMPQRHEIGLGLELFELRVWGFIKEGFSALGFGTGPMLGIWA